ncbi:unnamed protein product [Effrenium voratum]|nr:unnamed protein product [Effrenium voratum]
MSAEESWLEHLARDTSTEPLAPEQRKLAAALLQVALRRLQELRIPGRDNSTRRFLSSTLLDKTFLGDRAPWLEKERMVRPLRGQIALALELSQPEVYVDVLDAGELQEVFRPGDRIMGDNLAALEWADILVLDPSAVMLELEDCRAPVPALPSHPSGAKEFFQLSQLLRDHEAFEALESRRLREICRRPIQRCRKGEVLCREGESASGFFQILSGTCASSRRGAPLLQLREGSAVGEDVLLGLEETWRFSVVAQSDLELLWVDAKDFKEARLDRGQARRRALEARGSRLVPEYSGVFDFDCFAAAASDSLLLQCLCMYGTFRREELRLRQRLQVGDKDEFPWFMLFLFLVIMGTYSLVMYGSWDVATRLEVLGTRSSSVMKVMGQASTKVGDKIEHSVLEGKDAMTEGLWLMVQEVEHAMQETATLKAVISQMEKGDESVKAEYDRVMKVLTVQGQRVRVIRQGLRFVHEPNQANDFVDSLSSMMLVLSPLAELLPGHEVAARSLRASQQAIAEVQRDLAQIQGTLASLDHAVVVLEAHCKDFAWNVSILETAPD